jgi:hypothetical protein
MIQAPGYKKWLGSLTAPVPTRKVAPLADTSVTKRHTRRKPGPQSHGSSLSSATPSSRRHEGPHDRRAANSVARFWFGPASHKPKEDPVPKHSHIILSLLVGVVACDRHPTGPATGNDAVLNWMNNEDNGNIRIQRFKEEFAFSWTDPTNGLRATHTTFPIPFLDKPERDCGLQGKRLDPLDVQDVGLFLEGDLFFTSWLRRNEKGGVWVIIRDVSQSGDCYGNKLIAEGPGRIHYTDNDLFGVVEGDENANAFGVGASATVVTPDGRSLSYTGHGRFTVVAPGEQEPDFTHTQLVVNLQ